MTSKEERAEVEKKAAAAREAMSWVQGRLNVLEYIILFFALASKTYLRELKETIQ